MKLEKLILATFSMSALFSSSNLYAGPNSIVHSHLQEINYPSKQPKDTLGKASMYVPDAKTDLDREVAPGQLPQYQVPLYYGYKELKF